MRGSGWVTWAVLVAMPVGAAPAQTSAASAASGSETGSGAAGYDRGTSFGSSEKVNPVTPLYQLLTADDYPPVALRAGAQGKVWFDVTVGPDGSILDCTITQSSGFQALDDTTCSIGKRRLRFRPSPAGGHWQSAVRWILPAD